MKNTKKSSDLEHKKKEPPKPVLTKSITVIKSQPIQNEADKENKPIQDKVKWTDKVIAFFTICNL